MMFHVSNFHSCSRWMEDLRKLMKKFPEELKPHEFSSSLTCVDLTWSILMNRLPEGIDIRKKNECVDSVLIQFWFSFDSLSCFQATGANKLDFGSVSWPRRGVFFIFCPPEIVADLRCWTRRPNRWPSPWGIPTPYQWTINGLLWRMRTFGWTIPFGAWGSWCLGILGLGLGPV